VPIDRDDHDERLARVEQMIEDLRRRHPTVIVECHLDTIDAARRIHPRSTAAHAPMKSAATESREQRQLRKTREKKS
jgi:hypothetical protein